MVRSRGLGALGLLRVVGWKEGRGRRKCVCACVCLRVGLGGGRQMLVALSTPSGAQGCLIHPRLPQCGGLGVTRVEPQLLPSSPVWAEGGWKGCRCSARPAQARELCSLRSKALRAGSCSPHPNPQLESPRTRPHLPPRTGPSGQGSLSSRTPPCAAPAEQPEGRRAWPS